jgi:hypothetical protein
MTLKQILTALMLFATVILLPGCDLVEGIFKAGMWTAFLIVALIIGLILYIVARVRRK